ncbi:MAG TPA: type II secretion system protein, partial [Lacipirellulaceae bacterium]|nr:type II secretion system protein [Lacipirellulaceae bacterium]
MIAIIHCRRRGFSLIELMVTIGIIALLVSMLLPALGRARAQARQVSCASGLRQIGQGLYVYAAANRGWYPPFGSYQVYGGDGTGDDRPGLGWTEILAPHFVAPDAPIYKCPDFPEEDHRITYFLSARWAYLGNRNSIQQSAVRIASQYVLAAECTRLASYPPQFGRPPHVEDDCDKDDGYARSLVFFR